MKQKCMTILKVSVALILALMMVVGSISTVVAATITIEQADSASDSSVTDVAADPADADDAADEPVAAASSSGAIVDKLVDDVKEDIADADTQPADPAPLTTKLVRRVKEDIAGTGANSDLAGTGWDTSKTYYVKNNVTGSWNSDGTEMMKPGSDYSTAYYIFYIKYGEGENNKFNWRYYLGNCNAQPKQNSDFEETGARGEYVGFWTDNNYSWYINTNSDQFSDDGLYRAVKVGFDSSGDGKMWYSISKLNAMSTTLTANDSSSNLSITLGDTVKLNAATTNLSSSYNDNGSGGYKSKYTFQVKKDSGSYADYGSKVSRSGSDALTSGDFNWTPTEPGTYKLHVYANDDNLISGTNTKSGNSRYGLSNEITVTVTAAPYYLTGWLNGGSVTSAGAGLGFEQVDTNEYTLTYTFTGNQGGYQYPSVTKYTSSSSQTVYHPKTHGSGSGVAAFSTTDGFSTANADPKWCVDATTGVKVKFTLDTTDSSHPILSWKVKGATGDSTNTDYKVLQNTSAAVYSLTELSGATVKQEADGSFTVNLSSFINSLTGDRYIAISTDSNYYNILGGGSGSSNPTGSVVIKEGSTYFNQCANQDYYGQNTHSNDKYNYSHIKLQNSPAGLKVNVVVNGNKVTYNWYASGTAYTDGGGGAGDDTQVKVYAKDGCAPIDWDNKGHGGATGLDGYNSKYYYNFARIGRTHITKASGSEFSPAPTSHDCDINNGTSESKYETITLDAGSTIKVTTTIENANSWRSKYYVRGFCVNGKTYYGDKVGGKNNAAINTTRDTTTGVYTLTYTIPDDIAVDYLEITPIYYIYNVSTVTFYLEGFEDMIDQGWGSTPYAFPFYGDIYGYQDSFGVYPGQPFIYIDGKYYIDIPINSLGIYSDTNDGTKIKGVTVSNGYADHVHRNLIYGWTTGTDTGDDHTHMQTYDFDDFYKIYNEKADSQGNKPNAIMLRMKNETKRYNRDTYGDANNGVNWSFSKNDPDATRTAANIQDIATNGNGWELLTDRYGRPVDLFGNVIGTSYDPDVELSKPAIRVISTGYNETIAGDYGVGWLIYTPSGDSDAYTTAMTNADESNAGYMGGDYTLQTSSSSRKATPPSIFLLKDGNSFNTSTYPSVTNRTFDGATYSDKITDYKTIYDTLKTSGDDGHNALGRYVYVSYEENAQRKGQNASTSGDYGAFRMDARWYYTYATDMVNSKIKIQYWNGTKFVDEASYTTGYNSEANMGAYSKCKAYFTNAAFDGKMESGDVLINSIDYTFNAAAGSGWVFDSWNIEYDGGKRYAYDISEGEALGKTHASASDILVARFIPLSSGNLSIAHHLDEDSTGAGTPEINVTVYPSSTSLTNPMYTSGWTTDDVTLGSTYISNSHSAYFIKVELKTTPIGDDTCVTTFGTNGIEYSDDYESADLYTSATNKTSTSDTTSSIQASYTFTVGDLYSGSTQKYLSLMHKSQVARTNHYYNITYNYTDRAGASKSYTARGTFTANEYANTNYVSGVGGDVQPAFIKLKAPFESNLNSILTLEGQNAEQNYDSTNKVHTVSISYTGNSNVTLYATFDLPYRYYGAAVGGTDPIDGTKKYTAITESSGKILKTDSATFELTAGYKQYFTNNGSQDNTGKITDPTDPNHRGNDFVTAPDVIYDADKSQNLYFNYWQIKTADGTSEIARVYYKDFHYLAYGNYYVTPIYTTIDKVVTPIVSGLNASIVYLGDSRSQYNNPNAGTSNSADDAADMIYNEFAFAYGYNGELIKDVAADDNNDVEIGMIIERIEGSDTGASASVSDMSYYKTLYGASEETSKAAIDTYLKGGASPSFGAIKVEWDVDNLNNKNRMEKYYYFYSQYGQNVGSSYTDEGFYTNFKNNSTIDDYVYRAYSYIIVNDQVEVSEPAYFCMKYTANRKYS